jgi:hypothetical protein
MSILSNCLIQCVELKLFWVLEVWCMFQLYSWALVVVENWLN